MKISIITSILAVTFVMSICAGSLHAAASNLPDIEKAAQDGLPKFMALIPAGKESGYGFDVKPELSQLQLGSPYQTHTIQIKADGTEETRELNEWRFPVLVGNKPKALLTIAKIDGEWRAVDFGAAKLVRELADADNMKTSKLPTGKKIIFRNYSLKVDFAGYLPISGAIDTAEIIPLGSSKRIIDEAAYKSPHALTTTTESNLSYKDMVSIIRNGVNNNSSRGKK